MASLGRLSRAIARPLMAHRASVVTPAVKTYTIIVGKPGSTDATAWNKDWKPGPYPKTPAEREAAAKKYGLRPEDYEPYPDDGTGYGDYPMLPRVASEARSNYEVYDIPALKRNYGEVLHVDADAMTEDRWNANYKDRFSFGFMWTWTISVVGGIMLLYYLTLDYPNYNPAMEKQYPKSGVKHYTFEPAD